MGLQRSQNRPTPQLDQRRYRHQRLLRGWSANSPRLWRRAAGPRARAEDQRIILFVKLSPNHKLTEELKEKIKKAIRTEASPKHIPALILEVPDIPYTLNMKKVEVAVANIVNNRPVTNRDALANPESLDFYTGLLPLIQKN